MVPWYKQTSTENSDITFSCKKCFDMSEISKTLNCSPMETFSTVKQTFFDRKSCCNLFVHKTLRYQKVVEHRRVPLRSFSVLWDKKIPIENRDKPPFFLRRLFWYLRLSETQKGSPTNIFGTGRQNNFDKNRDISSLMQKFFKISKISNFLNGSPMATFSSMRQKNFDRELCFTPPVHRSLRYLKVVKHRRVPYEVLSYCETKIFGRKSWYHPSPHLLLHKNFRNPEVFEDTKGSLTNFFGHCETKTFRQKIVWYTPLVYNFCRYPKLVKHWRVPLQNSLALVRVDFCLWAVKMTKVVKKVPHFVAGIVWGTIPSDLPVFWIIVPGCSRNGNGTSPNLWVQKELIKLWQGTQDTWLRFAIFFWDFLSFSAFDLLRDLGDVILG